MPVIALFFQGEHYYKNYCNFSGRVRAETFDKQGLKKIINAVYFCYILDSHLHLLGKPNKFHYLQSLDLSENDIYELDELLQTLAELKQLMCLQLQGNPCSVCNSDLINMLVVFCV